MRDVVDVAAVLWWCGEQNNWTLLFSTDQWKRLVPTSWEVFPNAVSTALQYLSLQLPLGVPLAVAAALAQPPAG